MEFKRTPTETCLGNLRGNPMAKDICKSCDKTVIFWSVYRGDYLFGEKVKIPKDKYLEICSECGEIQNSTK